MVSNNARHLHALHVAKERIFQSKLADYAKELYLYGSMARGEVNWDSDIDLLLILDFPEHDRKTLKKEILFLKGSLTEDDIDAPEVDLKVVFGDEWKTSNQTYYRNVLEEGEKLWVKN